MKLRNLLTASLLLALLGAKTVKAEDVYYRIRFADLQFADGTLPKASDKPRSWSSHPNPPAEPYAILDGEGEVFLGGYEPIHTWTGTAAIYQSGTLNIRAPRDKDVTGRLFVPKPDSTGMVSLGFKIPAVGTKPSTPEDFFKAEENHYRMLANRNIPGGAWFRHQEQVAIQHRGIKTNTAPARPNRFQRGARFETDDTFDLFSGGRAVSENLQLDRTLLATTPAKTTVDLTNLTGITVKAMDWKPLINGLKPATDPLAACIPADQHAILFPSFHAMTQMIDEADVNGTPVLQMFEPRSEDGNSRDRYQKQLCLGLSEISRRLGPQVITSAAFTGSDPYLRTGTDVGILFETKSPEVLKAFILARQAAAAQADAEVKLVHGELEGVPYNGVVSADRATCSYVASRDNVVFVSNSLYQLGCLLGAAKGSKPALISQDEYTFFRNRYARGDSQESAFLILTDATIRRWCSPRWRIATSRRTHAAAVLAELQAAHLDTLVKGTAQTGPIQTDLQLVDGGELGLTRHGVTSSTYGTVDFLTPIAEIPMDKVTQGEADAYKRWCDTYQQNWSQYFDPIAVRFSVQPDQITTEVTVMPLILRTDYSQFTDLSNGAGIAPESGDPHPGTLAHFAMAINPESETVRQAGNFLGTVSPTIKANPLGWLGKAVALYADEGPFWDNLAKADDVGQFLEKQYAQIPAALYCEIKSPLGAAAFLTALRAYADQTAPGMAKWSNQNYKDQPYVKVSSSDEMGDPNDANKIVVYYAVTPKALMVTLNESVLKHALDRQLAKSTAKIAGTPLPANAMPWLGANLCLQLDQRFLTVLREVIDEQSPNAAQALSWNNLPILNEWKRRFPAEDPVKLHQQFWQTKLVCPGGGSYVWNAKWQTMESTIYGHPGDPKKGPSTLGPLSNISKANLGLNFEKEGLSAKAVLTRAIKQPQTAPQ